MKKLLCALILAPMILLGGCNGTTDINSFVQQVVANAKITCSAVINVEQLTQALTGVDLNTVSAVGLATSICEQVLLLEQKPPVVVGGAKRRALTEGDKFVVVINKKPVDVTVGGD